MTQPSARALSSRMSDNKKLAAWMMREVHATEPEVLLWGRLRASRCGVKFRRQVPMLGYIADFYAADCRLIVEVDGRRHDLAYDRRRDAAFARQQISTLRIPARIVYRNTDEAEAMVRLAIAEHTSARVKPTTLGR